MSEDRFPILGRGELYADEIKRKTGGGAKSYPRTYEESKSNLLTGLASITNAIENKAEIFLPEKVMCIRMEAKFEAKSYMPDTMFTLDGLQHIGGRKYNYFDKDGIENKAKLYFAKATDRGINNLKNTLETGTKDGNKQWREQLSGIKALDLLAPDEKFCGFPEEWNSGVVEVVIHPVSKCINVRSILLDLLKLPDEKYNISSYTDGPLFCAAVCNREILSGLLRLNVLRSVHPLGRLSLPEMRATSSKVVVTPSTTNGKSETIVGVFDGGFSAQSNLLSNHAQAFDLTTEPENSIAIAHGTSVCGAVLHGALNHKGSTLPPPLVSVDSFRVFPQSETGNPDEDLGLYGIIDQIESIVPHRQDIKVFNLSFGPAGAILDDDISRFTYALDKLSMLDHKPLFCVAVGNDGDLDDPFSRIQSPSDLINGLGVGAYTFTSDNQRARAPYSSIGPGREGCKVKPDIVEFGGSAEYPVLLAGCNGNNVISSYGTSFASPIVAGKIGGIIAKSDDVSHHMARTLLIHTAEHEADKCDKLGYGFIETNIDRIIECTASKVVVLYQGGIMPGQSLKLPICAPPLDAVKGNVNIIQTVTTIVQPNPLDADSYTNECIEDYFYPNDQRYKYTLYTAPKNIVKTEIQNTAEEQALLSQGYIKSTLPVSRPAKDFASEQTLRATHLKWDTVVKKKYPMRASTLNNPFFILQARCRSPFNASPVQFFMAITLEVKKYRGSLYDDTVRLYQYLTPIRIKSQEQIIIGV